MARFQWGLICQQAIIDKASNAVSYINALEQVTPSSLPVKLPPVTIGTLWRREEKGEDVEIRFVVEYEGGNVIAETDPETFTFEDHRRWRVNRVVGGIQIPKSGTVWFCMEKRETGEDEWSREAALPLDIDEPHNQSGESIPLAN
jgi:hypothetical protein